MEMGEAAEAIKYFQRLTQLTLEHTEVFARLGELYLQQGDYAAAALNLWEARELELNVLKVEGLLLQVYQKLLQQQQSVVKRLGKRAETLR